MRYFGQKPFVPLPVSARVPTMRLACNRLVINGLKILFVFRDANETLNVQNFVPREARVLETPADTVTPFENSLTAIDRQRLMNGRTFVLDRDVSKQEDKRNARKGGHR